MKCKVIIFLLLVLIVVMNFRLNILVIEGYCTGTNNEVTNPTSPYYDGIQDAFLFKFVIFIILGTVVNFNRYYLCLSRNYVSAF